MKDGQHTNGCFFIISGKCGPLQSNVHVDSFSGTKYLIFEFWTMHTRAIGAHQKNVSAPYRSGVDTIKEIPTHCQNPLHQAR